MVQIRSIKEARKDIYKPKGSLKEFFTHPNCELKGKHVVVLGNSPALNEVDLSLLKRVTTIGVNKICRVMTPDMVIFTDPPILKSEEEIWKKDFKGSLVTWQNFMKCWVHDAPNARYFNLKPVGRPSTWPWPMKKSDPLIRQGTTTAYGVQMAVLGGAKTVAILGIDFSAPQLAMRGGNTHFYNNPKDTGSTGGGGLSDVHRKFYGKVPKWAAQFGVECYNLSPFDNTPINQLKWPKLTVEQFVERFGDDEKVIDQN